MTQAILAIGALAAAMCYLARRLLREATAGKRRSCCGCGSTKLESKNS